MMVGTTTRAAAPILALLATLAVFALPGSAPLEAQARRQGPPPREELERRVRERFESMVNRELGLEAAQGDTLRGIVMQFQPERRTLGRRQMELRRELDALDGELGDERARTLLAELVAVQREEARILEVEIQRLLTVLTPAQAVRFYTLRERMAARMREMQDRTGGPPRRGGGGGEHPR